MTKTILITGATAGIGAAAARRFAAGGWRVIATGRRGDRLRALADELGDACLPLELDIRDKDAASHLAQLSPPWSDIDLLLNNAGLAPPMSPLQDSDLAAQTNVIETNITGLVALTRALLPKLIERRGGRRSVGTGLRGRLSCGKPGACGSARRSGGGNRRRGRGRWMNCRRAAGSEPLSGRGSKADDCRRREP